MKKFLTFMIALVAFLAMPVFMLAQAPPPPPPPEVGTVVSTIVETGFTNYFISLAALVPLVVLISAFINSKLKLSGFFKQFVAWIIAVGLCFVGWYFNLGMFAGIVWWVVLAYGFAVGLAANGFFDITLIQAILKALKLEKKNE